MSPNIHMATREPSNNRKSSNRSSRPQTSLRPPSSVRQGMPAFEVTPSKYHGPPESINKPLPNLPLSSRRHAIVPFLSRTLSTPVTTTVPNLPSNPNREHNPPPLRRISRTSSQADVNEKLSRRKGIVGGSAVLATGVPILATQPVSLDFQDILADVLIHAAHIQTACGDKRRDVEKLRSLISTFHILVAKLLDYTSELPGLVHASHRYILAWESAQFADKVFCDHAKAQFDPFRPEFYFKNAVSLLQLTLTSVRTMLDVAGLELDEPWKFYEYSIKWAEFEEQVPFPGSDDAEKSRDPGSDTEDDEDDSTTLVPSSERPSISIRASIASAYGKFPSLAKLTNDHPPSYTASQDTIYKHGRLWYASLHALIHHLTSQDAVADNGLVDSFFLTYDFWTTTEEVLDALIRRYKEAYDLYDPLKESCREEGRIAQLRVIRMMRNWIELYWRDDTPHSVIKGLRKFIDGHVYRDWPSAGPLLDQALVCTRSRTSRTVCRLRKAPASSPAEHATKFQKLVAALPNWTKLDNLHDMCRQYPSHVSIDRIDGGKMCDELARQLTVWASNLYRSLVPGEFLRHYQHKHGCTCAAQSAVQAITVYHDALTCWVMNSICDQRDRVVRTKVRRTWIKVARRCQKMRNFDSFYAIGNALNSKAVATLWKTYDNLEYHSRHDEKLLKAVTSTWQRFKVVREALKIDRAAVPPLASYQREIEKLLNGYERCAQSEKSSHMIPNIFIYDCVGQTIRQMEQWHQPYDISESVYIQSWLKNTLDPLIKEDVSALIKVLAARSLRMEGAEPPLTLVRRLRRTSSASDTSLYVANFTARAVACYRTLSTAKRKPPEGIENIHRLA